MKRNAKRLAGLLLCGTLLMGDCIGVYATDASSQTTETQSENTNAQTSTQTTESQTDGSSATSSESQSTETKTTSTETNGQTDSQSTEQKTGTESSESNLNGSVLEGANNDKVEIKEKDKPYLALGADLSDAQKSTVLSLMGIDPANLKNYDVAYITNADEHKYLDSYVDSSQIGTRSLSSVVIVKREKGNGLNISTKNISYCTVGMYKNALTTAGITDADIIVAGPTPISGTAALVGIFMAYQNMTGEVIDEEVVDAALNELVITGELENSIEGLTDEQVEEFIAYVKSLIAEKGLKDESSIKEAIDEACKKYEVTLSDSERQQITDLLLKISSLGIDLNGLVDYAKSLYDSFKTGNSTSGSGVISAIGNFFSNVFTTIGNFFKSLFH